MTCRGILDALSDYLEGEAGKAVCKMLEEHLEGCKRCRMHVDAMKQMVTIYKKWRSDPIPDDVSQRLQQVFSKECLGAPGRASKKPSRPRKAGPKKKRS
jgi:predicted anti-sigma-YlaC factor YlaD